MSVADDMKEVVLFGSIAYDKDVNGFIIASSKAIYSGTTTVATAGTAEQLIEDLPCKRVHIKANPTNAGDVTIGGSTSQDYILQPGEEITLNVANANIIYVNAANAGDGVNWLAEV